MTASIGEGKFMGLWSGKAHLGQVGGHVALVQDSFIRPSDTDQYAIGDAITDSVSAATALEWTVGRVRGGTGIIATALLIMGSAQATKLDSHLLIFSATPTVPHDNDAPAITDAEALTLVGVVDFGGTPDITNPASGVLGNVVYAQRSLDIVFECAATSKKLYGFLIAQNTYTPVTVETFAVTLGVLQD